MWRLGKLCRLGRCRQIVGSYDADAIAEVGVPHDVAKIDRETHSMGMDVLDVLERVRYLIRDTFAEFGVLPDACCSESMLIRNGFFCGRRFESAGFHAVWFIEERQVKFFDRDGAVMRVLDLNADHKDASSRKAA